MQGLEIQLKEAVMAKDASNVRDLLLAGAPINHLYRSNFEQDGVVVEGCETIFFTAAKHFKPAVFDELLAYYSALPSDNLKRKVRLQDDRLVDVITEYNEAVLPSEAGKVEFKVGDQLSLLDYVVLVANAAVFRNIALLFCGAAPHYLASFEVFAEKVGFEMAYCNEGGALIPFAERFISCLVSILPRSEDGRLVNEAKHSLALCLRKFIQGMCEAGDEWGLEHPEEYAGLYKEHRTIAIGVIKQYRIFGYFQDINDLLPANHFTIGGQVEGAYIAYHAAAQAEDSKIAGNCVASHK